MLKPVISESSLYVREVELKTQTFTIHVQSHRAARHAEWSKPTLLIRFELRYAREVPELVESLQVAVAAFEKEWL